MIGIALSAHRRPRPQLITRRSAAQAQRGVALIRRRRDAQQETMVCWNDWRSSSRPTLWLSARDLMRASARVARAGWSQAAAGTADAIDATVVLLAAAGDPILTSDPGDMTLLAAAAESRAVIIACSCSKNTPVFHTVVAALAHGAQGDVGRAGPDHVVSFPARVAAVATRLGRTPRRRSPRRRRPTSGSRPLSPARSCPSPQG